MPEFVYFFGYPARQWRYAAGMAALAGMMAFFALFAFLGALHEPSWLYKALKGGVAAFAAWGCWQFASSVFTGSIVPYFDRRVGVTNTFAQGREVAKNCQRLDKLALDKGVTPLSVFGFADDLRGDPLIWHNPQSGIETISALLRALATDSKDERLVEELSDIRSALQTAVEQGVKFSLILRSGEGTNSREHELRAGSFF